MKIVAIEPKNVRTHVFSAFKLPRLAMPLLGTILRDRGHQVKVFLEELGPVDENAVKEADLVLISTITSTAPRAYAMADRFRRQYGKTVVMGGVHVSFVPDEAIQHADFVLRGEGDDAIVELVEAIEAGGGFEKILGLTWRQNGKVIHNPPRKGVTDLDQLPIPDFSLIPGVDPKKMRIYPMMTSRGCPHACIFCSVAPMFGRRYRFRAKELLLEELARIEKGQHVFFYDDNFTAHRPRTKELLEGMIRQGFKGSWSAQVRIDIYKDKELLELMRKSNCFLVYVGIESINPETLKTYKKGLTYQEIYEGVQVLHKYGIRIHGMFVIGADTDTPETIQATLDFAREVRLDSAQFLVLTPIPGSVLYENWLKEGRVFSTQWDLYDGHHVVFHPKNLTLTKLQEEGFRLHREFYSLKEALRFLLRGDVYGAYLRFLGRRYVKRWIKENEDYFDKLREIEARVAMASTT
ncbi:MAG TPA: radical SAM protein [Thermodesulfatator atlanticus]|uniref:Radical SAM protein n=1 Tax=Thermodesulfatator atlanticus TaxID=501497 RepID=A0A7V5U255_9BACT|nr:radical SAM protein [Thermodesulfatator atlanticus]